MLDLSHLTFNIDVFFELFQLLLPRLRRSIVVFRVVTSFGELMRHFVERRLEFCDVIFELPDSRDLLRDDRRCGRVTRDADSDV